MRVRVLFFGVLKEMAGKSVDSIDLPEQASLRDLLAHYQSKIPRLEESLASVALAVNQQYARPDTVLRADDEVALLPPVSGGTSETPAVASSIGTGSQPKQRRRRAWIVREPIDTARTMASVKRGEDGAALVFEGIVRNQTRGRKTLYLDYEAY
jgi:molybdopterin synthase catalytic subunit